MQTDLSGQVAMVTGGSRGIGLAIAKALAAAGAGVALVARSQTALDAAADDIRAGGGRAVALAADVSDQRAVDWMVDETKRQLGPIDLLVNNAATARAIGPPWEVDPGVWWDEISTNLKGPFLCARAVLPGMVARRRGRIINVVSLLGIRTEPDSEENPYASAYTVSKAALMILTDCLATMTRAHGVQVFGLRPGFVRTAGLVEGAASPAGRQWLPELQEGLDLGGDVPPERAARMVVFLASGEADMFSGRVMSIRDEMETLPLRAEEIRREGRYVLRFFG